MKPTFRLPVGGALFLWGLLIFVGCASQGPILVGFSAQLTGRQSELGVASRNGATLALEHINAAGGVHGRPLALLVFDDQGQAEIARRVDAQLVEAGVVAIIGHPTSEMTAAVLPQMNQAGVVLLSGTSTSAGFSGKDDMFFRVIPGNDFIGVALARQLYQEDNLRTIVGIYDLNNAAFTETYWQAVQAEFIRLGGRVNGSVPFHSGEDDLQEVIAQAIKSKPGGLVFMTSAVDAALLSQYARIDGANMRLYASSWAQSPELIAKGGQAVQGMGLTAIYHPDYPSPAYQEFIKEYIDRFGMPPSLGASHSYEAVLVLAEALRISGGKAAGLPDALKSIQDFPALQGNISINPFGDVIRETYIVRVENGEFVLKHIIPPAP